MSHLNFFQRRQLADINTDVFNIREFGATGGTDDSAAVEAAALAASDLGGIVYIPAGTWYFDNITVYDKVYFKGEGYESTVISPTSGSTNPIFKRKVTGTLEGAGFSHMYLYGNGTDQGHGIDLSLATKWQFSPANIGLKIENFNIGIKTSANDRRPYFSDANIWGNNIGIWVGGSHCQLDNIDFRNNTIGLSGDNMYDMQIENCSFVRNGHGILPDDFSGGGYIQQALITGCQFFGNYQGAAVVGARVKFVNCLLVSTTEASTEADSFGVWFDGSDCGWVGGIVAVETGDGFGDYAFIIDSAENCDIQGVTFNVNKFVRTVASRTTYRRIKIDNNVGNITKGRFAYLQVGANEFQGCSVSGNHIGITGVQADYVDELTTGDGFIENDLSHFDIGNRFCDNIFHALEDGILAYAIDVDARGCVVTGNICRKTAGINLESTDVDTVNANNVYHAGA